MTRVTLIDPQTAGVSGDMILGALIDAGAEVKAIQRVLDLIPHHFPRCKDVRLSAQDVKRHGFRSCRAELTISETADETSAEELLQATQGVVDSADLSEDANSFANDAIRLLTDVESALHGTEISRMHLHEAGSTDTLADILGTAAGCDSLGIFGGEVYSCPIAVGGGMVSFSHGTVSVPAPAVLEIARRLQIPIIGGPVNQELATPTGLSILASLVDGFVEVPPALVPDKVGYGAGREELSNAPNILRVIIGQSYGERFEHEPVQVIETNLDDVSGEIVGNCMQRILDAGAKDVWVTPAQFKKSRPGYTLHALCACDDLEKISEIIFMETGTLGVRYQRWDRFVLQRETVLVKVAIEQKTFEVRVKVARDQAGEILRVKPEFEDLNSISQAISRPVREISGLVLEEVRKSIGKGSDV